MNLTVAEAAALAIAIETGSADAKCDIIIFPTNILIPAVQQVLKTKTIKIGAQNCSDKESGAFTGEVSAAQLVSAHVEYVLVGHSERREHFGETNETLREKLKQALKHNLKPIFCCGEPLNIREQNLEESYVLAQLKESLFDLSAEEMRHVILAYEPVWAIGTGLNATAEQAQDMHAFIRKQIADNYGGELAERIRILYGGSCKPENAATLFKGVDVDGGLIGGASLKANDFMALIAMAK